MANLHPEYPSEPPRRSFLKGAFAGIISAGLIVSASPQEIEVFAAPLKEGTPLVLDRKPYVSPYAPSYGEFLYNEAGERVAVITRVALDYEVMELLSNRSPYYDLRPGYPSVTIEARGVYSEDRT